MFMLYSKSTLGFLSLLFVIAMGYLVRCIWARRKGRDCWYTALAHTLDRRFSSLEGRLNFVRAAIPLVAPEELERVTVWVEQQVAQTLSNYNSPHADDIPLLIGVGQEKGAAFLVEV